MVKALKDKVVLIGMPGCGKTTIGKVLAKELNYNFYDMDSYIEEISEKTVKELFVDGEEVFRAWETKACEELSKKKRAIISSGGGVIKKCINTEILRKEGIILFIDRPIEMILEDVDVNSRPLLNGGKEKIYELYDERYELYNAAADEVIANEGFLRDTIDDAIKTLKNKIKE
ncbi:shikimate kinase [Clostridium paraputrificum]|uniref:shikimate kinase n=1 Tax=Clostridium TaxID=1485 RepID=UPI003D32DBCA